eukprot:937426-Prymnesium_polylepis.1
MKTCAGRGSPSVAIFGGIHGARRFVAGTEDRAAKLGSYGGLQRARDPTKLWASGCMGWPLDASR